MIATGISSGTRTLYTDDEEHTFTVRRPVIFNGIPGDLTERSDLASRTIKLEIPRIVRRRTKVDLEREFEETWPGVFGALLDGLVGGLRDGRGIEVDDPARLMDFEQFAEAGCRVMGFEEWEFVEAYKAWLPLIVGREYNHVTVSSCFIRHFKLGDNINYNLSVLAVL